MRCSCRTASRSWSPRTAAATPPMARIAAWPARNSACKSSCCSGHAGGGAGRGDDRGCGRRGSIMRGVPLAPIGRRADQRRRRPRLRSITNGSRAGLRSGASLHVGRVRIRHPASVVMLTCSSQRPTARPGHHRGRWRQRGTRRARRSKARPSCQGARARSDCRARSTTKPAPAAASRRRSISSHGLRLSESDKAQETGRAERRPAPPPPAWR